MKITLESVALELWDDVHSRIHVTPYHHIVVKVVMWANFHIALQCPKVAVIEWKSSEQCHCRDISVGRNPPLHNLVAVEFHRLALPADILDLCHTDYLKTPAGGYHAEIACFLVCALAGVIHFEFRTAVRALATCKCITQTAVPAFPLVSADTAGHCSALGSVGDMLNAVVVCPLDLRIGYGSQGG